MINENGRRQGVDGAGLQVGRPGQIARIVRAKRELERIIDCVGDIIVQVDVAGRVRRCNRAFADSVGLRGYREILGRPWEELLAAGGLERLPGEACEQGCRKYHHPASGRIFCCRRFSLFGGRRQWERGEAEQSARQSSAVAAHAAEQSRQDGEVITLQDVTEQARLAEKYKANNRELAAAYDDLKASQAKLLQQEKLASIGQLAAGVAHEINNPVGFVTSNLGTLNKYVGRLREFAAALEELIGRGGGAKVQAAAEARRRLKIDLIEKDAPELLQESLDGVERVRVIVQNLKNFARLDQARFGRADLNQCLEETLNIIWNELKYKAEVRKDYGELPPVWCHPQQLNQVFMNLLINAAQAIKEKGVISIKTRPAAGDRVMILINDTGRGIAQEHLSRLFEPFFTTKEVGQGTGLGLSIAYDIVAKQHGGEITAASAPGVGTTFRIMLPVGLEQAATAD